MRIRAAMDIGTNSTRLLIATPEKIIHQETNITRIGEGLKEHNLIQDIPLSRTIKVLKKYKEKISEYKIEGGDYFLVATSAMRDAVNSKEVVERIKNETGLNVEVITGEREAELSYLGATGDFPGKNVVIDIGGGSSEVIFEDDPTHKLTYTSTNLGGVRLKENLELQQEEKIKELFAEKIPSIQKLKRTSLIGVGGTITTIASIKLGMTEYQWEKVHGLTLKLDEIKEIHNKLEKLSLEERKKVPGLQPERADIIVYGTKILITFMEEYGYDKIITSDKDLLFALITSSIN